MLRSWVSWYISISHNLSSRVEKASGKGTVYRALFNVDYTDQSGTLLVGMAGIENLDSLTYDSDEDDANEVYARNPIGQVSPNCWASIHAKRYADIETPDTTMGHFAILQYSQDEWDALQTKYRLMFWFGITFFIILGLAAIWVVIYRICLSF
eukprot:TRINITY_DN6330_c0_g1_i1.p2 TRINITY_DN6330_c0_g1~~TRINITY_DN6330_c0_g1_i1.p2  ORF type:complete len:153 (+),score=23.40 TRINITY_DN6330_c0_g1_i1:724-1182(+)